MWLPFVYIPVNSGKLVCVKIPLLCSLGKIVATELGTADAGGHPHGAGPRRMVWAANLQFVGLLDGQGLHSMLRPLLHGRLLRKLVDTLLGGTALEGKI